MKSNITRHFSVNLIQLVVNQGFALLIFFVLSTQLDKAGFGSINLALSILLAAFNILSLGIDQLIVKKIASGEDIKLHLSLYCFHVAISGSVFYGILAICYWLFPAALSVQLWVLLLIGLGKLAIYWSTPFKQAATGMERFDLFAVISVVSNAVRGLALAAFAFLHQVSFGTVILIFIAGDVCEFVVSVVTFCVKTGQLPNLNWNLKHYSSLVKTALPQAGVVVITSALARFDWIYIGATISVIKLAEYSFAYKIYELSTLPLLALAPLLMTRLTKALKENTLNANNMRHLVRAEMAVAAFTMVAINMCWQPLMDALTGGKYGQVNQYTIFILSLSIPFIYLNNIFWTIYFAQGRLSMIFRSFLLSVCINIGLDVALIPLLKNEGAAMAVLLSLAGQFTFYIKQENPLQGSKLVISMALCSLSAVVCIAASKWAFANSLPGMLMAIVLYVALLLVTGQLRLSDKEKIRALLQH